MTLSVGMLRRAHALPLAALVAAALAGCSDPTEPAPRFARECRAGEPVTPLAPELAATLPQGGVDVDVSLASLARTAPGGFAGLRRDAANHRYVVSLTRPSEREAALAVIGARLGRDLSHAAVERARWDYSQLYDWRRYLERDVLAGAELTSRDIDEVANRLKYGVRNKAALHEVAARLDAAGVPCSLVVVEVVPPARLDLQR